MTGATKVAVAGATVMGVAFGMVRYVYGLTLPAVRAELGLGELMLGLVASGTHVGFLLALVSAAPLASRLGPRAATTVGGVCGTVGCALVAVAPTPGVLAAGALVAGSSAGWVWAPYSDVVAAVAPSDARPRLLARITAGAGAGLALVGPLALVTGTWGSWRWTWGAVAALSVLAAVLNLRWVPRVPPAPSPGRRGGVRWRVIARPLLLAAVLFAGATAYLTYATDVARRGGLGDAAGPVIFLVVGLAGLAGSATGWLSGRWGADVVAAGALGAVGVALALLVTDATSATLVVVSAALLGAGNTVGSATVAIWTAERVPDRPGAAFTVALVTGSLAAVATPAAVGALTPSVGLSTVLLTVAIATVLTGAALAARRRR